MHILVTKKFKKWSDWSKTYTKVVGLAFIFIMVKKLSKTTIPINTYDQKCVAYAVCHTLKINKT